MKNRFGRIAILALALVALAASAAGAATSATQHVDLNVLPADTLAINVDGEMYLGTEAGGTTDWQDFWIGITNTTSTGFEVSALSDGLIGYYHDNCDEFGENCEVVLTGDTIPASAIEVAGGDFDGWGDPGAIVGSTGTLSDTTPLVVVTGTAAAYGDFGLDDPWPQLRVTVPGTATAGQYYADIVYTIIATS